MVLEVPEVIARVDARGQDLDAAAVVSSLGFRLTADSARGSASSKRPFSSRAKA
jgi:hypothetical protein